LNAKSIEKYLERQTLGRLLREELEYKKNNYMSGNNWSPKLTVPEGPSFMDIS
jgi:hypothetical protein